MSVDKLPEIFFPTQTLTLSYSEFKLNSDSVTGLQIKTATFNLIIFISDSQLQIASKELFSIV